MDHLDPTLTPLRVAFDARDLTEPAQRGMVRYIVGLTRNLGRYGVRATLFHRARQPLDAAHVAESGCEAVGLRDASGLYWEQVSVPLALARGGFDLYHAPAERGVPFLAPCPVVFTIHSATALSYADLVKRGELPGPASRYLGYASGRPSWYSRLAQAQTRRADSIVTVSEFAREELIRLMKMPSSKIAVTPLGLPEAFSRPTDPARIERTLAHRRVKPPYLLFVGGFEAHKNPSGFLAAAAAVRRLRPDISVVIVGSGKVPNNLVRLSAAAGFTPETAVFLSNLREELVDLYDGAAVYVSLSWRESFGMPSLEAMARGIPVVVSAWGAAPEIVGAAGRLIDPRDPETVAAAVMRALDPAGRADAAARGRAKAAEFTWDRTAELTARIYSRLAMKREFSATQLPGGM